MHIVTSNTVFMEGKIMAIEENTLSEIIEDIIESDHKRDKKFIEYQEKRISELKKLKRQKIKRERKNDEPGR